MTEPSDVDVIEWARVEHGVSVEREGWMFYDGKKWHSKLTLAQLVARARLFYLAAHRPDPVEALAEKMRELAEESEAYREMAEGTIRRHLAPLAEAYRAWMCADAIPDTDWLKLKTDLRDALAAWFPDNTKG